jgi:hypothetical protein
MHFPLALLLMLAAALAVAAAEPESRPSVSLLLDQPAWLHSGRCVVYAENSPGWAGSAPEYFVRGRVVSTRVEERRLAVCPVVPGKAVDHYSREEFNRLALAAPCVSAESLRRDVRLGLVRLRVDQWETPHARRAENGGRLYRGMFIDQKLSAGSEIELEADLLASCPD